MGGVDDGNMSGVSYLTPSLLGSDGLLSQAGCLPFDQ